MSDTASAAPPADSAAPATGAPAAPAQPVEQTTAPAEQPAPQAVDAKPDDKSSTADKAKPDKKPSLDDLIARNNALEAALRETSTNAKQASEQVEALRVEAVTARRKAAFASIGLPDAYHALAPDGDPAAPDFGLKLEQWAARPEYAHLLRSRGPVAPDVDTSKFGVSPDGRSSIYTSPEHARANWADLNRRG